jgi:hypothetical protein
MYRMAGRARPLTVGRFQPYGYTSGLGETKPGFKFSFKSMSFKERHASQPSTQSPLRECHYPRHEDMAAEEGEHKEKKRGLAMKMGG